MPSHTARRRSKGHCQCTLQSRPSRPSTNTRRSSGRCSDSALEVDAVRRVKDYQSVLCLICGERALVLGETYEW